MKENNKDTQQDQDIPLDQLNFLKNLGRDGWEHDDNTAIDSFKGRLESITDRPHLHFGGKDSPSYLRPNLSHNDWAKYQRIPTHTDHTNTRGRQLPQLFSSLF